MIFLFLKPSLALLEAKLQKGQYLLESAATKTKVFLDCNGHDLFRTVGKT